MADPLWTPLVTAEQLHEAAERVRDDAPAGTPEGHAQAQEVGRFIQGSHFLPRDDDGRIGEELELDTQAMGWGVMIGLLVRPQLSDVLEFERIPVERHWAVSILLHQALGHEEPWEVCSGGCDRLADDVILELFGKERGA